MSVTSSLMAGLFLVVLSSAASTAVAQGRCQPIRFDAGRSSAEVRGSAPAEDVVCFTLSTGNGQTAKLRVSGRNVIFSVLDIADARDNLEFKTRQRTYTIRVGQLMRAVQNEAFVLSVSVN